MASYLEAKKEQLSNANSIIVVAKTLNIGDSAIGGYKTCIPDWCELLGNPKFCEQFKDVIIHIPEKDIVSTKPKYADNKELSEIIIHQDADVLLECLSSIRAKDLKDLKAPDVLPPTIEGGNEDEIGVIYNKVLETVVTVVVTAVVNEILGGPTIGDLMKKAKKELEK